MMKKQRGGALIEFALVLPILITIVFGITEFGRAFYYYNALTKSVRDATRYLSTQTAGAAGTAAAAQNLAVYGIPSGGSTSIIPGLTTQMVSVCDAASCPSTHQSQGTNPVTNLVTVTITGAPFTSLALVLPSFNFNTISMTMRQAS